MGFAYRRRVVNRPAHRQRIEHLRVEVFIIDAFRRQVFPEKTLFVEIFGQVSVWNGYPAAAGAGADLTCLFEPSKLM